MTGIPEYISPRNQNHMPFDEGAVTDAFESVLGIPTQNKTTKTMCGKRVVVSRANHKADTTCPECQLTLTRKWSAEKRLKEALAAERGLAAKENQL